MGENIVNKLYTPYVILAQYSNALYFGASVCNTEEK
jgi:hypothetical protein